MAYKQEWHRETANSVNTGARIPNSLYARLLRYQDESGHSKTDIINAALRQYLPKYDEEGEGEE